MAIEHNTISTGELHEPKGIASATHGQVYIAEGDGTGAWRSIPHAHYTYSDIGTGTTVSTPAAYTLIGPATSADSDPHDFTHNSLGRETYTGSETIDFTIITTITFKHSAGAGADCYFDIHKNGATLAGAEFVSTADSSTYATLTIMGHGSLVTNDYLEVFCKVSSGSIVVHALSFDVIGLI